MPFAEAFRSACCLTTTLTFPVLVRLRFDCPEYPNGMGAQSVDGGFSAGFRRGERDVVSMRDPSPDRPPEPRRVSAARAPSTWGLTWLRPPGGLPWADRSPRLIALALVGAGALPPIGLAALPGGLSMLGAPRTGIVLGTPSFMSPEQLEGRTVTGRSDLFSLGVSLFQLLTGQLPFTADSMTGLMQQIAEAPHPPLRAFRPDLPACRQSIIDRALAKNPDARYDSGAQMAAALEDCRSRLPSGLP